MAKKIASDEYAKMDDTSLFGTNAEDFDNWNSQQLADFLSSAGLVAYRKMVLENKKCY